MIMQGADMKKFYKMCNLLKNNLCICTGWQDGGKNAGQSYSGAVS